MQITTEGNMLNFGYWYDKTQNPLHAQYTLSKMIEEFACLQTARRIISLIQITIFFEPQLIQDSCNIRGYFILSVPS